MKKYLAMALAAVGMLVSGFATTGCWVLVFDEPKMPKAMLNK